MMWERFLCGSEERVLQIELHTFLLWEPLFFLCNSISKRWSGLIICDLVSLLLYPTASEPFTWNRWEQSLLAATPKFHWETEAWQPTFDCWCITHFRRQIPKFLALAQKYLFQSRAVSFGQFSVVREALFPHWKSQLLTDFCRSLWLPM